jgi:hypothetical protein
VRIEVKGRNLQVTDELRESRALATQAPPPMTGAEEAV